MFEGSLITSLDLSNYEINTTKNMENMFNNCQMLEYLKIPFNTKNIDNMTYILAKYIFLISLNTYIVFICLRLNNFF